MTEFQDIIGRSHEKLVFGRRAKAIANAIAPLLPSGQVLDLGCGNGMIAHLISQARPDIRIIGADVVMRPHTLIPVVGYDGHRLPFTDSAFDCATIVDALHHTTDFRSVLSEALRVARCVVVKDHFYRNRLEHLLLRGMDWYGNMAHGVALPYNYFTRAEWEDVLSGLGVGEIHRQEAVPKMYAPFAQQLIGRNLQFISMLRK
jgi:SAM-dependent methyltransferase